MTLLEVLDRRPLLVALAGPNGAGKTTFHHAHLKPAGLRLVNADVLTATLGLEAAAAMRVADALRQTLVARGESFVFETVFSDPVGDKLAFLKETAASGHSVVLVFIGLSGPRVSEARVAMRVSQGGHDVPAEKLIARYPRTLKNLKAALRELPYVLVYDNSDLRRTYRRVAVYEHGACVARSPEVPAWFRALEPSGAYPA